MKKKKEEKTKRRRLVSQSELSIVRDWVCVCVSETVCVSACLLVGWVAACFFVCAGLTTTSWPESWFRLGEQQHLSSDVYCKALMWQNHSPLCSAPHCFTSDVSPSPYKPTDKILSHFLLSFVFYISFVGPQYPLKGGIWARSSSMFVVFHYFWYVVFIFSESGCLNDTSVCVTQVFAVCFAALLLNTHEHVCKYRPLKARTQNTNM